MELCLASNHQNVLFFFSKTPENVVEKLNDTKKTYSSCVDAGPQNVLDIVDVKELMTQFIEKTSERKAAFGSV